MSAWDGYDAWLEREAQRAYEQELEHERQLEDEQLEDERADWMPW